MVVDPALDVSQAGRDPGRDLCVRWVGGGEGEKELGIISIADDGTKGPRVQREEEGTDD